jgi:hypothetical protein
MNRGPQETMRDEVARADALSQPAAVKATDRSDVLGIPNETSFQEESLPPTGTRPPAGLRPNGRDAQASGARPAPLAATAIADSISALEPVDAQSFVRVRMSEVSKDTLKVRDIAVSKSVEFATTADPQDVSLSEERDSDRAPAYGPPRGVPYRPLPSGAAQSPGQRTENISLPEFEESRHENAVAQAPTPSPSSGKSEGTVQTRPATFESPAATDVRVQNQLARANRLEVPVPDASQPDELPHQSADWDQGRPSEYAGKPEREFVTSGAGATAPDQNGPSPSPASESGGVVPASQGSAAPPEVAEGVVSGTDEGSTWNTTGRALPLAEDRHDAASPRPERPVRPRIPAAPLAEAISDDVDAVASPASRNRGTSVNADPRRPVLLTLRQAHSPRDPAGPETIPSPAEPQTSRPAQPRQPMESDPSQEEPSENPPPAERQGKEDGASPQASVPQGERQTQSAAIDPAPGIGSAARDLSQLATSAAAASNQSNNTALETAAVARTANPAQARAQEGKGLPDLPAFAAQIAARSGSGTKTFDIRLDPPELGRVEVRLTVSGEGKAEAHLTVDRPYTLELLRRDSHDLERALKDAGLELAGNTLNFSLRGEQRQGDGGGFQPRARTLTDSVVARAEAENAREPINHAAPGSARLDIRI